MTDWRKLKWLPVAAGALLCALGLACLVWPETMLGMLPILIGVCVLALGLTETAFGFAMRAAGGAGTSILQGVVNVAVGLVFLFNRKVTLMFIAILIGVWLLAAGVLRLSTVRAQRAVGAHWGTALADGLLRLVFGVLMFLRPLGGLGAGTMIVGAGLLFGGASVILGALYVDRTFRDMEETMRSLDDNDPFPF